MPRLKTRNLFVSHSWSYGDAYDRLIKLLQRAPNFAFRDYSVPKDDPVHDAPNAPALRRAIKRQMAPCQVILIVAGKYATLSTWIKREIEIAKRDFAKPIVGIQPRPTSQVSSVVRVAADRIVSWNTASIVAAIRELVP